ncbi:MAG: hypothetical protein HQ557_02760 [Bacteroidetes bacterium]|nr:hypothetical protein [Bacteroidota bacterium]
MKQYTQENPLLIITGSTASGRTLSLRLMEDLGYIGIDNIPPGLIPQLADSYREANPGSRLVIVTEMKSSDAAAKFIAAVNLFREQGNSCKVIFLDANETTALNRMGLIRKEKETPEIKIVCLNLFEEREMLAVVKQTADIYLDTSLLSPTDLKSRLVSSVGGGEISEGFLLEIKSFGFKYAPFYGDIVFDVRFIPNPYYISELRPLSGKDKACYEYVMRNSDAGYFVSSFGKMVTDLIQSYAAQGRSRLSVGIGCTGGRHRSVAITEALGEMLNANGIRVTIGHRELDSV